MKIIDMKIYVYLRYYVVLNVKVTKLCIALTCIIEINFF